MPDVIEQDAETVRQRHTLWLVKREMFGQSKFSRDKTVFPQPAGSGECQARQNPLMILPN